MDIPYTDLYDLGTAVISIITIIVYDVVKGGVKWYQSVARLLKSIADDPNRRL